MAHTFPLYSRTILILSIIEFITGSLKSASYRKSSFWANSCLIGFGLLEAAMCIIIGISIATEIQPLIHWYSKVIYSMAIASDFVFLFLDVMLVRFLIAKQRNRLTSSETIKLNWNVAVDVLVLCLVFVVFLSVSFILAIILFNNANSSFSVIAVMDISDNERPPNSFWICAFGFLLLFICALLLLEHYWDIIDFGYYQTAIVALIFFVSLPLVIGSGLRASKEFAPGFVFITITTLPPIASYLFTVLKDTFLDDVTEIRQNLYEIGP